MELPEYLDKKVSITILNGFYYKGKVLDADDKSITILDIKGRRVSLSKENILSIEELE